MDAIHFLTALKKCNGMSDSQHDSKKNDTTWTQRTTQLMVNNSIQAINHRV